MKQGKGIMLRLTATLLGGGLALGLAACGGGGGDDSPAPPPPPPSGAYDAKAVIDNLADNVITATYAALDARAADLASAVQALDDGDPTEGDMDAAQAAWRAARVPWESSEGFLFGPVDALGIDPSIDSWPLNTADLQAFLVSNPNATQADIENASDDLRGFHAIEYLLFGDGVTDNEKAASELTPAEIKYLAALTAAFRARTQLLASSWTTDFNGQGPYAALVKSPGAGNASYSSQSAVMQEFVNGVAGIAAEVGEAKIGEPLGPTAGAADTSLVESQYSWNSLTDFHNNIQSILNMYTGKVGFQPSTDTVAASMNGLYAFVAAQDQALATRTLEEILDAQRKIALIKGDGDSSTTVIGAGAQPFRNQISDPTGRTLIQAAIDALAKLKTTLETDVLPLVGRTTFAG